MHIHILPLSLLFIATSLGFSAPPRVLDANYELTLFAEHPDIVTPVGLTFDHHGRLLVIESHTHFPPDDYPGPTTDRIRILTDSDGDGRADDFQNFYSGTKATMSIRAAGDKSVTIATRNEILQLRDTNHDGVAEHSRRLVHLDTPGNYPHNGLGGLCFVDRDIMLFGLGENLGEPYRLIGSDGTTLSGGGEGGNIYRCRIDGSQLERLATGFWNPFGICTDPQGRIFTVGNDPDARPPSRLIHVVPGGDYGYQFRYGRSGRHPLQAWNGELPGTLPYVSGTGEAPSAVVAYHGALWGTSWGDYRIERFKLRSQGASWLADTRTIVQGDDDFRPVDFALAPDGSLYFTDWVDKSYNVHRKGRVWRLRWKSDQPEPAHAFPAFTGAEQRAQQLRVHPRWDALDDDDPFMRQAAVWGMANSPTLNDTSWEQLATARQRLGWLLAHQWTAPQNGDILSRAWRDPDHRIRLAAIRWAASENLAQYRTDIARQLDSPDGSPALYRAAAAAVAWLDNRQADPNEGHLRRIAFDTQKTSKVRAWALRTLPIAADDPHWDQWIAASRDDDPFIRQESVWSIAFCEHPDRHAPLAAMAQDTETPHKIRAIATLGLARDAQRHQALLVELSNDPSPIVRNQARRGLRESIAPDPRRPEPDDVNGWSQLAAAQGDPDTGKRIFFDPRVGRCGQCHTVDGHGNDVGPDLTGIGKRLSRRRIVESLLLPNREISPRYSIQQLEMDDGRMLQGFSKGQSEGGRIETFLDPQGNEFQVETVHIATRSSTPQSIMPSNLVTTLTISEFQDLLALLDQE